MLSTKNLLVGVLALGCSISAFAQRTCSSHEHMLEAIAHDPAIESRMHAIEAHTAAYAANPSATQRATVTIPVVVHVLYNTATQNITDAQVNSQIAVLNADFAGTNADASLLPAAFAGARVGNTNIQFCLAKRTPAGVATTGIVHKSTTTASFGSDDKVKYSAQGGDDAWDATKYLNLWVCNLGGGLLGYAQFPGGPVATDGVVILYSAFGNTGTVNAPYNKGRTATHEVGHWLNLRHIWGDANCGSDLVTDTPTSQTSNFGCPTYPHVTCSNGANGDMFMNYMDYTDDACMYMFSTGQSTRMNALFATGGSRVGLVSSLGCQAPTTSTSCGVPASLTSSSVTATTATIAWGAVSGAASYSVQYKTAAAASWTTVTTAATSLALSGLTASTTYNFQVASVCNTTSAYSTAASFTTAAANTTPTYCTSSGAAITDEYIQTVKLAKTATPTVFVINNNTPTTTTSGYSNFTATTVNVARGTAYTITVVPKWTATVYSEGYNVWIDYNRNGVFTDAGESVFVKAASTATPATGSFTIPTTATLGTTRMRVQMKYGANATSCEAFGYGEVEDYTLNIATTAREISPEATANAVGTGMIVYPNPTNEDLTVELTQWNGTTAQARLLDLMGREVQQFQMTGSSKTINVAQLPTGVYFISILTDDKQVVTQKFVKQ